MRGDCCFVDIDRLVDHHCLNFLLINWQLPPVNEMINKNGIKWVFCTLVKQQLLIGYKETAGNILIGQDEDETYNCNF